jgi:hypothetical protein
MESLLVLVLFLGSIVGWVTRHGARFERAIDERDAGLGLPGPGGHSEEHLAPALSNGCLRRLDGGFW